MKILVSVKRVPDYETKVRPRADGKGIETAGLRWIMNPFDEIAVEEAVRLKEKKHFSEVVVVTFGPAECVEQLRKALAIGADRAIHVQLDGECDSDLAARLLQALYNREQPRLVLMGKQAIDSDAGQTPQLLATYLDIAHGSFASAIAVEGDAALTVTREVDGGLETVRLPLPAVVSTDLRLNTPRYVALPGILAAKKKPLETVAAATLGVELTTKVRVRQLSLPPQRGRGRMVSGAEELVRVLRDEAKVL